MYFQKRFIQDKTHFLYELNITVLLSLWSGIMIFCREVDAAIHLPALGTTYFQTNYEITVVRRIHISRLELQRWSLEFVISFYTIYIWDLGLRFG
jgi:hypothetical protein